MIRKDVLLEMYLLADQPGMSHLDVQELYNAAKISVDVNMKKKEEVMAEALEQISKEGGL